MLSKSRMAVAAALVTGWLTATPGQAANFEDQARVVLNNGATLQQAVETCAGRVILTPSDTLALSLARQGAQTVLPGNAFILLDTAASEQAIEASQSPTFCDKAAKRKPALIDAVKKAGQRLITARVLGL